MNRFAIATNTTGRGGAEMAAEPIHGQVRQPSANCLLNIHNAIPARGPSRRPPHSRIRKPAGGQRIWIPTDRGTGLRIRPTTRAATSSNHRRDLDVIGDQVSVHRCAPAVFGDGMPDSRAGDRSRAKSERNSAVGSSRLPGRCQYTRNVPHPEWACARMFFTDPGHSLRGQNVERHHRVASRNRLDRQGG